MIPDQVRASFLERTTWGDDAELEWLEPKENTMGAKIPTLPEELERAADLLDNYNDGLAMFPRAVVVLRKKAESLRAAKQPHKPKARTVTAYVGKKRTKGSQLRIAVKRLEIEADAEGSE